jgi:hypothetical protein
MSSDSIFIISSSGLQSGSKNLRSGDLILAEVLLLFVVLQIEEVSLAVVEVDIRKSSMSSCKIIKMELF